MGEYFGEHIKEAWRAMQNLSSTNPECCSGDSHKFPPTIGDPVPEEAFNGMRCYCGRAHLEQHKCHCGNNHLRVVVDKPGQAEEA